MDPIDPYLAELAGTKRSTLRQRCLQQACNRLAPGDLTRLYLQLDGIGGRALCEVAPNYHYMTGWARRRASRRPQLQPDPPVVSTQMYRSPDKAANRRRLYIVFSGEMGQFFVPLALILHVLPGRYKDILVIRNTGDSLYRFGVEGLGLTPYDISLSLQAQFPLEEYNHVSVLGFSAGGLMAMAVADFLAADIGLSFAGICVCRMKKLAELRAAGETAFDPLCVCRKQTAGILANVASTKNELDFRETLRLAFVRPRLIQYHVLKTSSHNVISRMVRSRTIDLFFRVALHETGTPLRLAAAPFRLLGDFGRYMRARYGVRKVPRPYARQGER